MAGALLDEEIKSKIDSCPNIGSLKSINAELCGLVSSELSNSYEIAEVIRKDPALTTRLLKLVNSVLYGLARKITNIEEAIIYLGSRQIKELALATPVIEDFENFNKKNHNINWNAFWQHSIGTAMITRDLLSIANLPSLDESDYILGLVHNVGKLVLAFAFPETFEVISERECVDPKQVCFLEREYLGWDHGRIGAWFLKKHQLADPILEAVEYHHFPEKAPNHPKLTSAIQVADCMVRASGINSLEMINPSEQVDWQDLPGWGILFDGKDDQTTSAIENLLHSLKRLPDALKGMLEESHVGT